MGAGTAPRRAGALLRAAAASLAVLVPAACGYQLVGKGGSFPAEVSTVAVQTFKNNTSRYQLENRIAQSLVNSIMATGKVKIADEKAADAVFSGTVTAYDNNPISYNVAREVTERRVIVTAKVDFKVRGHEEAFFSESGLTGRSDYPVVNNLVRDTELEKEAELKALDDLTSKVISRIIEGF